MSEVVPHSPAGEPPVDDVADGVTRALDPRSVTVDRIVGWIVAAVLGGASLVALIVSALVGAHGGWQTIGLAAAWLAGLALLSWLAHAWPAIEYRHISYRVDAEGIEIRRGVVWRTVTNVPRSRVQHTDVSQGPIDRSHGLGTLVIYTAGTEHARVVLSGLRHELALRIRDHLLPKARPDAV